MKSTVRIAPALAGVLMAAAGCSLEPRHVPNPLLLPGMAVGNAVTEAAYQRRRGAVEFFVKDNHPALMRDITRGGGGFLTEAMALAGVPEATRPALQLELRGDRALYAQSPDALVVTLMVYGR